MKKRKIVMDAEGIERSLTRVAYQIVEKNKGVEDVVLVGIQKGGVCWRSGWAGKSPRSRVFRSPWGSSTSRFTGTTS